MFRSRGLATLVSLVLSLTVAPLAPTVAPAGTAAPISRVPSSQVVLDWERILFRTVYTDALTPIPVGVPVLGFTSLAMYHAARASHHRGHSSEPAAVAAAAHDVLLHYYPAAAAKLDADLVKSLASVPDGPAETRGVRTGRMAAAAMLASRVDDHYLDSTIHYTKTPGTGVWQPTAPNTDMLAAWLGSLRPVVLKRLVHVDGPDSLRSDDYAFDFNEAKLYGGKTSARRSDEETNIALFFNSNSATMVGDALIRHLEANPMSLRSTVRLFAMIHAAMTDSAIRCWQLKRDVGFWRPSQAIAQAGADGNPATTSEAGWVPLVTPEPNYSDYVSGHACLTSAAVEPIRMILGEDTPLELISVNSPTHRFYAHLSDIETDAFNARIWSGLHFRDAMEDGYRVGHLTARRVAQRLR